MSKLVRYQFLGSWLVFWFECITVIGIPIAVLYLISSTVRVETEVENPEELVAAFRSGRHKPT